jgi:diguanylate cyclase (GGDEF)-like protein
MPRQGTVWRRRRREGTLDAPVRAAVVDPRDDDVSGRRSRRFWAMGSLGVLLVGVTCSLLGATAWDSYLRVQATRNFDVSASTTAGALSNALQQKTDLAETAGVLVQTNPSIEDSTFAHWFQLLEAHSLHHSAFALLYIERVDTSQLASFESRTRAQPPFGLPTRGPVQITPSGAKPPYCLTDAGVVRLNKGLGIPAASLSPLLALASDELDLCALPIDHLLRASARSGQPAAATLASVLSTLPKSAGSVSLPRSLLSTFQRDGLITTLTPVYGGDASSAAARTADLRGWILEVFEARKILGYAYSGHRHFSALLSFRNPSGKEVVLARDGPVFGAAGTPKHGSTKTFRLSGPGPWSVSVAASPNDASATTQGVVVLLGGLLVSFLLFAVVRLLVRSRGRAVNLVDERTAQLRHQALHDVLTGLPNRAAMIEWVGDALTRSRIRGSGVAVIRLHIDRFYDVNNRFGRSAGDRMLCEVGSRLRAAAPSGTVGRLGGVEFLVLLEHEPSVSTVSGREGAGEGARRDDESAVPDAGTVGRSVGDVEGETVARNVLRAMQEPFRPERPSTSSGVLLTASVGLAAGPADTAETLVADAGIACFEARHTDGHFATFQPEMRAAVQRRLETEADLRTALAEDQFFVVYQPILDLHERRLVGVEALLRWDHPVRGVVPPGEFIPALESSGMIVEAGRRVLATVCSQVARWRAGSLPEIYVSVNVSGRQLERDDIVDEVRDALRDAGLTADALQLEITETALMGDAELSARRLHALKGTGVKLAVDDFGTGYCSLAYLRLFPVDALKIDQSFVASIETSHAGRSLVRTVLRMGQDLALETVAEGIETSQQLDELQREGCTLGQGFLFAPPLTARQISAMLKAYGPYPFGNAADARRPAPSARDAAHAASPAFDQPGGESVQRLRRISRG